MKKSLVIIILVILLVAGYFMFAKFTCRTPYQEIFVVYRDSTGLITDLKQCEYVGWKSLYSRPVN